MAVCEQGRRGFPSRPGHSACPGPAHSGRPARPARPRGLHERMDARRFWVAPGVAGSVAAAGYRVLLPDRRWSGAATTGPVSEHTWALEGADLGAVPRHAGAAPALVVAGSNGCSAALRLALDQPELVAGLVLAWPPLREDGWLLEAFERSTDFAAARDPAPRWEPGAGEALPSGATSGAVGSPAAAGAGEPGQDEGPEQ